MNTTPHWLEYSWVNLSHVCRLLWGSSTRTVTGRLAYRRKHPNSWTPAELARLEDIRQSFAAQLAANQPETHL